MIKIDDTNIPVALLILSVDIGDIQQVLFAVTQSTEDKEYSGYLRFKHNNPELNFTQCLVPRNAMTRDEMMAHLGEMADSLYELGKSLGKNPNLQKLEFPEGATLEECTELLAKSDLVWIGKGDNAEAAKGDLESKKFLASLAEDKIH